MEHVTKFFRYRISLLVGDSANADSRPARINFRNHKTPLLESGGFYTNSECLPAPTVFIIIVAIVACTHTTVQADPEVILGESGNALMSQSNKEKRNKAGHNVSQDHTQDERRCGTHEGEMLVKTNTCAKRSCRKFPERE